MEDERLEREAAKMIFAAPAKPVEEAEPAEPQGPEIAFVCPFCNEAYTVSEDLAGKTIPCRNCRELSRVAEKKRKKKRWRFDAASFGIGIAIGAVAMAMIAGFLKAVGVL